MTDDTREDDEDVRWMRMDEMMDDDRGMGADVG